MILYKLRISWRNITRDNDAEPRVFKKRLNIKETFFKTLLGKIIVKKARLGVFELIFRTLGGTKIFKKWSFIGHFTTSKRFFGKICIILKSGLGIVIPKHYSNRLLLVSAIASVASKIYLESKLFPGRLSWGNFIPGRNCDDCVILIYTHHISACIFILNSVMLQQRPSCVQNGLIKMHVKYWTLQFIDLLATLADWLQ